MQVNGLSESYPMSIKNEAMWHTQAITHVHDYSDVIQSNKYKPVNEEIGRIIVLLK